jgi:hypothetical protein
MFDHIMFSELFKVMQVSNEMDCPGCMRRGEQPVSGTTGARTTSWGGLQQTTPSVDPLTSAYTSTTSSARSVRAKRAPRHSTTARAPASEGHTEATVSSTSPLKTVQETTSCAVSSAMVPITSPPVRKEPAPDMHIVHAVEVMRTVAHPVTKPGQMRAGKSEGREETSHIGPNRVISSSLDAVEKSAVENSSAAVSAAEAVRPVVNNQMGTTEPSFPHAGPAVGDTVWPAAANVISLQVIPPSQPEATDAGAWTRSAAADVPLSTFLPVEQVEGPETVESQRHAAVTEAATYSNMSGVVDEHTECGDAARPPGSTRSPNSEGTSASKGKGHVPVLSPLGSAARGDPDRVADAAGGVGGQKAGSLSLAHAGAARAGAFSDLGVLVRPWDAVGGLDTGVTRLH